MGYLLKKVAASTFIGVLTALVRCRYTEKHEAQQTIATLHWIDAQLKDDEEKLYLYKALRQQEEFVAGYGLFRPYVDWMRIPMDSDCY